MVGGVTWNVCTGSDQEAQARPEPGGVFLLQEAGALEEKLSSIHWLPRPEQTEEEAR